MAKSGGRKRRPQGCSLRSHRLQRLKPLTPTLSPATHSAMPSMLPCCTSDLKRRRSPVLSCGFEADGLDERIEIIDDAVVEAIELRALVVRDFGISAERAKKTCGQRGVDALE